MEALRTWLLPSGRMSLRMTDKSANTSHKSTMTLERGLHRQCPNCCAPGQYLSAPWVRSGYTEAQVQEMIQMDPSLKAKANYFRAGWPAVYVEMDDPRREQPVGTTCPQCGHSRPKSKALRVMKIKGSLLPFAFG